MSDRIDALLAMLERGQDSALLRFSLGNEYAAEARYDEAVQHLEKAVLLDPGYSAAWKLLGRAQLNAGQEDQAAETWRKGVAVAEQGGDRQAAKEMTVFLRRLEKNRSR